MSRQAEPDRDETRWPYGSLLLFGYFGAREPAGRKLAIRTTVALAAVVLAVLALEGVLLRSVPAAVWALVIPAAVIGMVWANAAYLRTLDELSQTIQLKAFAFAYGSVMVLASAYFALLLAHPAAAGWLGAGGFMVWLIVAEPLRGLALVHLARRFE